LKFVDFARSNFNIPRSRPPFFVSASWHSTQFFWRNGSRSLPAGAPRSETPASKNRTLMAQWNLFIFIIWKAIDYPTGHAKSRPRMLNGYFDLLAPVRIHAQAQ